MSGGLPMQIKTSTEDGKKTLTEDENYFLVTA
jgi:hypothetical protein